VSQQNEGHDDRLSYNLDMGENRKIRLLLGLLAAAAVFALALLPRLVGIGETGFDLDEMATAAWVLSHGLRDLVAQLWGLHEGNAIGYPFFIYLWGKLSQDPAWLRLPSALAGAGAVALFYLAHARRLGALPSLLCALLLALAAALLFHSQNARVYAVFTFSSFLGLLLFQKSLNQPTALWLAAYTAVSALSLYLHHFAFLYFGTLWACAFWLVGRGKAGKAHLLPPALSLLLYLPHLPLLLHQLRHGPKWIPSITAERAWSTLESLLWIHHPLPTLLAAALAALGIVVAVREKHWLLLAFTFAPLFLGAALSLVFRNVFVSHYFLPSSLGLFSLAAIGAAAFSSRSKLAPPALIVLTVLALAFSLTRLPGFYAEPRRGNFLAAAETIRQNPERCSLRVVTEPLLLRRWPIYLPAHLSLSGWHSPLPEKPFWILSAGYPMPDYLEWIARNTGTDLWTGNGALVACIRE
jgi:mannosyltransferase